tara:strand:+ start:61 stop:636 length:576 start_codon:yes stop_codon:yes gene_type:complete
MASIAEEVAANQRAQAEGYANAAAKEADANTRSQAAGFSNAVAQEIDANKRAQAAGFRNAAEQEMDANRRSREAGFGNAALQEMDANRRAQAAGWANAAVQETGLQRNNIEFYLDDGYNFSAEQSYAPTEESIQSLFDFFAEQKSGQTPFQMNVPKSFGFLFNEQFTPYLGNSGSGPLSSIRGMIGMRGNV